MNKLRELLRNNNYRLGLTQLSDVVNELADEIDKGGNGDARSTKYTDSENIGVTNVQDAIDTIIKEVIVNNDKLETIIG